MKRSLTALLAGASLLACSQRNVGPPDASVPADAGAWADAGPDGGASDAGRDAGPSDAGSDAGLDAGPDAGCDAGADAGTDAGLADAGLPDSGSSDAGADSGNPCSPPVGAPSPCAGSACPWASAAPGDLVALGTLDPSTLTPPALQAAAAPDAGTLVFSDDPETFTSSGVLYEDTVGPGLVRLFVYHVNGAASAKKVSVVLENDAPSNAVQASLLASGVAGPSSNYLYTGKVAVDRWLQSTVGATLDIAAGQAALLDATLDGTAVPTNDLMHGVYDLELTGPLRVFIVALDSTTDTLSAYAALAVLPRGNHQRGTFWPANILVSSSCPVDTASGVFDFPLPSSLPVNGTDATTGQAEVLGGQYGVLTEVDLAVSSSDGRSLALILDPRGGDYGGAAVVPSGLTTGGVIELPTASTSTVDQGIVVGLYSPTVQPFVGPFVWTLPGGSSAPVDLLLVPY